MEYVVEFKPRAIKDLKSLHPDTSDRIIAKIEGLQNNLSGDVKKLTNFTPEYRLRVGDYRVLFELAIAAWVGERNPVSQKCTTEPRILRIMGKKNHKKAIRSLNRRIAEHQDKIRLEYEKDFPDEGLIGHWQFRY